ncbi:hypothetical protein QTG54_010035 [Skeletonema marinoi]|uniref:Uncharacterized protein n=1 Tax=Skeletonema marinoi TaxID=267567 RepID=A0AAD8Y5N8_9STRA|nr:hypothetical protein QTG54_010035 [Skeletonema marinoi]
MSSYARQGFHYNRNRLSQSSNTRDAENGSLVGGGTGGRGRSVNNGHQQRNHHHAGGIQRFSRQNRIMALSQTDEQGGHEIMVDHNAGGEFSLSQGTEITLTQALLEPDKKQNQQQQRSRSSSSGAPTKNDDRSLSTHRHLAGRTPRAMGGRGGGMNGRGGLHPPSNQKRRQIQQQNIQLSQKKKKNQRMNPNQPQRPMVGNSHRNFTTPVAGSGRLLTSSKSVSSRNNGLLSQSMHEEDDASTIQSRSLLTQESQGGGGSRFGGQQQQQQQRQHQSMKRSSTPHNNGQQPQQQQQRSNMSMTSNTTTHQRIPSLASSRRPVSTAVRTLGGISTTFATLATPSKKAFHTMTSYAARTVARTGATLGLTPCNFRSRSAMLSSSSRLSSGTGVAAASGGVRTSLSKSVVGANGILVKRPEEEEEEADDASKVTQKTYDPAEEKDDGGASLAAQEEAAAAANDEKEKKKVDDFLSKVQTAMDDKMKQFDEKLNNKFTEKKQELEEFFERTTKTFKESVSKIEGIQVAMDAFPTKVASSTQECEVQIHQLVGQSKEEIEKESLRVVESISSNARAVADDEANRSISEVVNSVIATAKGDFQVWTEGVLAGMRSSMIGHRHPVDAVSGEESTAVGANDSTETENCGVKEHCQQPNAFSGQGVQSNSDKENEQPDTEEETAQVDDTETKCSTVETQTFDDNQSGKWSDEEEDAADEKEEALKKGETPFSSKATPSTTTTPFSRKTTPVKNNYGKNRKSIQSSRTAHDDVDELKSEVQHGQKVHNDFSVVTSPNSKHVTSSKKKRANRASPSSPQIPLKLSSSKKKRGGSPLPLSPRIDNRKTKSAKKAPKCESKHKMKAKSPSQQKAPRYSQVSREESTHPSKAKAQQKNSDELADKLPMKQKASKKTDAAPQLSQRSEKKSGRSKKSENAPQLSQRSDKKQTESAPQLSQRSDKKRDQSAVNVEKNTRRSKRLKESTRAEKAALKTRAEQAALRTQKKKAKASKAKQVTPLDDGARQVQSIATKKGPSNALSSFHNPSPSQGNDDDNLDAELHTYPANDVDQLLGTSIVVTETSGGGDDSSGLDPDEGLVDKPKVKLFTPFETRGRRRKKSYDRKSKAAAAVKAGKNKPKAESVWAFNW